MTTEVCAKTTVVVTRETAGVVVAVKTVAVRVVVAAVLLVVVFVDVEVEPGAAQEQSPLTEVGAIVSMLAREATLSALLLMTLRFMKRRAFRAGAGLGPPITEAVEIVVVIVATVVVDSTTEIELVKAVTVAVELAMLVEVAVLVLIRADAVDTVRKVVVVEWVAVKTVATARCKN